MHGAGAVGVAPDVAVEKGTETAGAVIFAIFLADGCLVDPGTQVPLPQRASAAAFQRTA